MAKWNTQQKTAHCREESDPIFSLSLSQYIIELHFTSYGYIISIYIESCILYYPSAYSPNKTWLLFRTIAVPVATTHKLQKQSWSLGQLKCGRSSRRYQHIITPSNPKMHHYEYYSLNEACMPSGGHSGMRRGHDEVVEWEGPGFRRDAQQRWITPHSGTDWPALCLAPCNLCLWGSLSSSWDLTAGSTGSKLLAGGKLTPMPNHLRTNWVLHYVTHLESRETDGCKAALTIH